MSERTSRSQRVSHIIESQRVKGLERIFSLEIILKIQIRKPKSKGQVAGEVH